MAAIGSCGCDQERCSFNCNRYAFRHLSLPKVDIQPYRGKEVESCQSISICRNVRLLRFLFDCLYESSAYSNQHPVYPFQYVHVLLD